MPMRGENWRFWLPVGLLAAFAVYVSQQLVRAHIAPNVDSLDYTFEKSVNACRGSVFDAFGEKVPLVKSVPVWEYRLDPVDLTNRIVRVKGEKGPRSRAAIVRTISDALKLDYGKVMAMAENAAKRYQFLAVSSDPVAHRILADSKLVSGIVIEDTQVRQYLHGRLMSHVLGSVNAEGVGSAGIELKYDRWLSGVPGKIRGMKNARGAELYDRRKEAIPPIPGSSVFLTIDHNLQYEAETALQWGVREYGAGSGWCLVMDSATGAVLAMASLPDFDPLLFGRARESAKVNRVTSFTFEPGSVMKVITAAAAIDAGMVGPDSLYSTNRDDDRYFRLPGDGRHVWEPRMSVKDAIVHSSNIVMGKIGYDLGPERLWTYMSKFGFGSKTGIELPGEECGILPYWKKWDKVKWSRAPIGQGVSVTAIQLASAYQAIANDGLRMQPYVVNRVTDRDGNDLYSHVPTPAGRPITAATARKVRAMMLGVASPDGTARRAAIRGYSVAGKTGTAQKVIDGRYSDTLFRATFCGIVPAGKPRIVVLVTLDFDENRLYHQGGNSAAPIFRRLATAALRYLMVEPDRPDEIDEYDEDEFDRIMEERAKKLDNNGQ
jgi:cell division protein FtsI/penicillin-binding protein 2